MIKIGKQYNLNTMKVNVKGSSCLMLLLAIMLGCSSEQKKSVIADDAPRRIELLFLGHDQDHHNSRVYMPVLAAALTKEGINLTYTEEVDDLNTKNLELYDGLIIYANHETISDSEEKSILDFVSSGKAFIPIHSASFCFKNSPKYIDLVGAQFKEHGTGTFTARITDQTHPAMAAVQEFSTWDETYIHDKIAEDITVLMERVEGDQAEPWTWVKNYGKGKVFYTAYGHDERTWNNPGFQKLIKEGILWAVNDNTKNNWSAFVKDIPKLRYEDRDSIPNYEKRDPPLKYQLPLSPEESAKLIQVPAGFDLQLFASEPDIINPIAMNWDEKGRLWVIETVDYPNTVREDKGMGDDRIKILEDTDGDGKADKVTVFAEQLNIPTSFAFYDGGIIVSQAPHFLYLKDTDGDDQADTREIIIDGWGTFDTHAGPSNLQYGIDNNIYGVVGYSGFEGSIYGQKFQFRQNMYRFNPKKENFEVLTNTSNNTWGLGISEDNSLFASTANNTHSVFLGIPNKNFDGVEGIPAQGSLKIDGHYAMQPITPNVRQVDVFGGFTAAAGHHFYTARDYPVNYWNKAAFVCEPTGGLVHIARIE
ncbi:MAG: ThuA domain-containing protein, partial [Eudoraea sp.]|nr:ThuA domain-containing protein [Eudoraea sp.]